jgi:hypothetical protein
MATTNIATPAAFAEAVAKLGAPLGLDLDSITWRISTDKDAVVTIRMVSESAQLALFTTEPGR